MLGGYDAPAGSGGTCTPPVVPILVQQGSRRQPLFACIVQWHHPSELKVSLTVCSVVAQCALLLTCVVPAAAPAAAPGWCCSSDLLRRLPATPAGARQLYAAIFTPPPTAATHTSNSTAPGSSARWPTAAGVGPGPHASAAAAGRAGAGWAAAAGTAGAAPMAAAGGGRGGGAGDVPQGRGEAGGRSSSSSAKRPRKVEVRAHHQHLLPLLQQLIGGWGPAGAAEDSATGSTWSHAAGVSLCAVVWSNTRAAI